MAKFYGAVGYGELVETAAGVYTDVITEKIHSGDIIRNSRQLQQGENLNKDLSLQNSVSFVADAYANEHFFAIRYVEWAGARWAVAEVTVERPRLICRLGGIYNGPTPA